MRVLQIILMVLGLVFVCKAQIDCVVENKISFQDYDGIIISNAKVDLLKVGNNFTRTRIYSPQQNENNEFIIKTSTSKILTDTEESFFITENYRLRVNAENFKETERKIEFKRCEPQTIKITLEKFKQDIKITGVIFDPNGAIVVGVSVTATNKKGQVFETKTNDDGTYLLKLLPDSYKLEFEQVGFKKLIVEDFDVVNSTYGKISQDIVLEVGSCSDCNGDIYGENPDTKDKQIRVKKIEKSNIVIKKRNLEDLESPKKKT